jgi:asparagine synthase (glutamine-hydrolysing)
MCGICGVWNLSGRPIHPAALDRMRDSLAHRGPDGAASLLADSQSPQRTLLRTDSGPDARAHGNREVTADVGLGHRRLSIVDLEGGLQPMANEDATIWITFNGEIYNHLDLRPILEERGHRFRTRCDTEVILHAYEEYGEACVERLNGIFAFAIWDGPQRRLFVARDHFGVKPLYYRIDPERFLFGSEAKAILAWPDIRAEPDLEALDLCLGFRFVPSPWSPFQGIRKLPPGHSLTLSPEGHRLKCFREDDFGIDRGPDEAEWIERLRFGMDAAVDRQLMSDVPVALSLSSGVDSGTMLALMQRHVAEPATAFTVGFSGKESESEIGPARRLAESLGARFHARTITADDYAAFMQRYLWHLEEPIANTSAAAYYFVARMASDEGVKVLLTGQGADEVFAGYPRFLGPAYHRWLRAATIWPLRPLLSAALGGTRLGERYRRFLSTAGATDEADLLARTFSILPSERRLALYRPEVAARIDPELHRSVMRDMLDRAPAGKPLERMSFVDVRTSLADDLLLCEDKMAMAAGVEARVPYLDREFMRIAETIPARFRLRGRRGKHIFREACRTWVPEEVAERPKIGFGNAMDLWMRQHLGERLERSAASEGSLLHRLFEPRRIAGLLAEHRSERRLHDSVLFLLLSLDSWQRAFDV